ncbi:restriction endonuclease subunit S [Acinetobacter indicus]|nr:restriction endonuclease subunit S [Acinetobacter indicus]
MAAPKLRFKEFDGDWCFRKIGDISECIVPGRNKPKLFDGDIPWVTTPDLKDKTYVSDTRSNYYISEDEAKSVGSKIVPTNSVIMSCVGDLGLFAINTKPIVINQQLHAFILDDHKYSSIFVLNALSKNQDYIEKVATKTALPYLNKDNCNSIPLFLCSFKEQTKIASFLSAVDEKINQLTQKHQLLSQYKQGMMQKLFSQQLRFKADDGSEFGEWENTVLGDIADIVGGGTPSTNNEEYWSGDVVWLTPSEINQKFIGESKRTISELGVQKSSAKKLPIGTILFTSRATIGEVAIAIAEVTTNQGFQSFISNEKTFNEFLYYWIVNNKKSFIERASGSTFLEISKSKIQPMEISLPCLEEQTKIANFLSAIDQKIEVVAQQIEQAKTWKKGLLQQMFV